MLFLQLQTQEFLYAFFSLSDAIVGSIFYLTTGLHGLHVLLGCFAMFLLISYSLFALMNHLRKNNVVNYMNAEPHSFISDQNTNREKIYVDHPIKGHNPL
jgi:heme/copper-type cytochrome/quinol oxidase subunit 3